VRLVRRRRTAPATLSTSYRAGIVATVVSATLVRRHSSAPSPKRGSKGSASRRTQGHACRFGSARHGRSTGPCSKARSTAHQTRRSGAAGRSSLSRGRVALTPGWRPDAGPGVLMGKYRDCAECGGGFTRHCSYQGHIGIGSGRDLMGRAGMPSRCCPEPPWL
jgi:hypothetical protein